MSRRWLARPFTGELSRILRHNELKDEHPDHASPEDDEEHCEEPPGPEEDENTPSPEAATSLNPTKNLPSWFARHLLTEIAHDVRTPLTALRMNTSLLREESLGSLNEQQRLVVENAGHDAERLILLLDTYIGLLLEPPRNLVAELRPTDLDSTLHQIMAKLRVVADMADITVQRRHEGENLRFIRASAPALEKVLQALLLVAFKISPPRKTVEVHSCNGEGNTNAVELHIIIEEPAPNPRLLSKALGLAGSGNDAEEEIEIARRSILWGCREITRGMEAELEICSFGDNHSGFKLVFSSAQDE